MKWMRVLALGTVLAGYATVVLGGYVSATGAGLACPDWPTCNGRLIPDLADPLVATEYAHRLAAMLTGAFALAALVAVWSFHRGRRGLLVATTLAFGLLAVQVALGWITVASFLRPAIVTAHLGVATAFVATMSIGTLLAFRS